MQFVTAQINRQALVNNVKKIKSKVPNSKLIAVVKANGYGHGAFAVANALKDQVEGFAVARIDEAMELRRDGVTKPIFLLEGFYNDEDLPFISKYNLYTAVHDFEQVEAIEKCNVTKPIHVWLQIDCGMHRLGSRNKAEVLEIKKRLEACKNVVPGKKYSGLSNSYIILISYDSLNFNFFTSINSSPSSIAIVFSST